MNPACDDRHRHHWSADDDARLRAQWELVPIATIAHGLGRTRTTTYWRARLLKLQCGAPPGWEYLSAAAKRCGYTTGQLRRILRWARVRPRLAQARTAGTRRAHHVLEEGDADDAVERWLATETPQAAARRHGMAGCTLVRWLMEAGVDLGRVRPARQRASRTRAHRRVATETIDRIVSERKRLMATTENLSEASRRVSVGRNTLRKWLRKAMVSWDGRYARLDPADVDRAVRMARRGDGATAAVGLPAREGRRC